MFNRTGATAKRVLSNGKFFLNINIPKFIIQFTHSNCLPVKSNSFIRIELFDEQSSIW